MNRWSKNGVLQRLFETLQLEGIIQIKMESLCLDSTSVKVHHPDGTGPLKKPAGKALAVPEADSQPKFIWSPRLTVRL
jgi:hypothetical protein